MPPGTQSGQRFRLRERGAPSTRDGRRGDLVVEVRLMLPKVLDERSKELLREFGRINGENVRELGRGSMAKRAERGKAYYMISAVSQKYNIHPQTLRLYEREGLLKPSRTEGNTRLYSEEDLEQLETILALTRDLGVNLAGVEIILNMRRKIEQMQGEVNEFMDYVKRELARGIDDWEQRLSTALVKSSPTDLVQAHAPAGAERRRKSQKSKVKESKVSSRVRIQRFAVQRYDPSCPARSATTPAGRRSRSTVSRASRAATACASRAAARLLAEARIPRRYQHCDSRQLRRLQRAADQGAAARAPRLAEAFPGGRQGAVPQGPPGVGKTHLAVAVLRQVDPHPRRARHLLRHARSAAGDPQHLRPGESDRRRWTCCGR